MIFVAALALGVGFVCGYVAGYLDGRRRQQREMEAELAPINDQIEDTLAWVAEHDERAARRGHRFLPRTHASLMCLRCGQPPEADVHATSEGS